MLDRSAPEGSLRVAAPVVLGELLTADEIAARYFKGKPSRRWVQKRMPRDKAVKLGNQPHWYEVDVAEAVVNMRGAA
jgi:hypothetical protein